jgi:hypothetical protein
MMSLCIGASKQLAAAAASRGTKAAQHEELSCSSKAVPAAQLAPPAVLLHWLLW